jgi:aldose 1-epimerase
MLIDQKQFGKLPDGREAQLYNLQNDNDIRIGITNFGGIVTTILAPDRDGNKSDIVLGFDTLEGYLGDHPYFGAIVGRVANRISNAKFRLNQKEYRLLVNNGPNHLHGGGEGFDKKLWQADTLQTEDAVSLILKYTSPDGEEGYPGNLETKVIYTLNNDNELVIEYEAVTDKDTVLNLTNHSYFNLNIGKGNILGHELYLDCNYYTPADDNSITTGEILSVKGTPFDFTEGKTIGRDFSKLENGYDINFVINKPNNEFAWIGKVYEHSSGRILEVGTTEPGVQLYTSNYLHNITGKDGVIYKEQFALCLETQHFPDSPNKLHFPTVILKKGEHYMQKTVYKFGVSNSKKG